MTDPPLIDLQALGRFEDLLLMLARAQIGPKYRGKVDPEEIVNQTMFDAHRQRDQFRGTTEGELAAWLKRMLHDNARDTIKFLHRDKRDIDRELQKPVGDQSYSHLLSITCGLTSPSMKLLKHERELALADALAELPDDQREAIELHHLHGCTLADTAELMERTASAVVGLLRRGRKRLQQILSESIL